MNDALLYGDLAPVRPRRNHREPADPIAAGQRNDCAGGVMEADEPKEKPDLILAKIARQDLSILSLDDLRERIGNMKTDIARCEALIASKSDTRAAAEKLFRF